jgi:hypothetical protein
MQDEQDRSAEGERIARVALIVAAMAFALSILGLFLPIH